MVFEMVSDRDSQMNSQMHFKIDFEGFNNAINFQLVNFEMHPFKSDI